MKLEPIIQSEVSQKDKDHYNILTHIYGIQVGFRKGRGTRDQITNICWIIERARVFQKSIYFCFTDYAQSLRLCDHNKLWKILKKMGIPDHLTCLLRNLYAGQEATVRTEHGTTDYEEKEYVKAVYCHPAYLIYMQSTP